MGDIGAFSVITKDMASNLCKYVNEHYGDWMYNTRHNKRFISIHCHILKASHISRVYGFENVRNHILVVLGPKGYDEYDGVKRDMKEILDIMEGGENAFNKRKEIYGICK